MNYAGVPSNVCTKLGFKASFNKAAIAPFALKSFALTGSHSHKYNL